MSGNSGISWTMQMICTSLQTDNHTSTSPLSFFIGLMPFLPPNQQRQRTTGRRNSKGNQLPRLTWKMAVETVWGVKIDNEQITTFWLEVDTSSKKKLDNVSSEDQLQRMEVVESAGGYEQLLVSRRRIIVSVESRQREAQSDEVMKHVKVKDAATSRLVGLTVTVVTHQRYTAPQPTTHIKHSGTNGVRPVKTECGGTGVVICLQRGANNLHTVQLMPLPPRHLLLQQNPEWFAFLVPAYTGWPGKKGHYTDAVVVVVLVCITNVLKTIFQGSLAQPTAFKVTQRHLWKMLTY